jgi:hypothetical protein
MINVDYDVSCYCAYAHVDATVTNRGIPDIGADEEKHESGNENRQQ